MGSTDETAQAAKFSPAIPTAIIRIVSGFHVFKGLAIAYVLFPAAPVFRFG
jgi:hypothetical protein